jgi:hypothetical protein
MSKLNYTGFSRTKFEEIVLRHYRNAYVTRRLYTEYQDDKVKPINLTLYYSNVDVLKPVHIATWQKNKAWMEGIA